MINLDSYNNHPDVKRFKKVINPDYQPIKDYQPIDLVEFLGERVKLTLSYYNISPITFNTRIESVSSEYFCHHPMGYYKDKRFTSYHLIKSIEVL